MEHFCEAINDWSKEPLRRVYDAQGIYLCRVCEQCEPVKLAQYRPEILSGYSQADVDEPIEPDEADEELEAKWAYEDWYTRRAENGWGE